MTWKDGLWAAVDGRGVVVGWWKGWAQRKRVTRHSMRDTFTQVGWLAEEAGGGGGLCVIGGRYVWGWKGRVQMERLTRQSMHDTFIDAKIKIFAVRTHALIPNFVLSQLSMVDEFAGCTLCVNTV